MGTLEHLVDSSINYALAKQASSEGDEGLAALKKVELIVANTIELMEQSGQSVSDRKIRWTAERF